MGTLVAGGAIAFAVTGGSSHAGSRWREVAIHERVVLLPSGEAGVEGWCLTTLCGSEGGDTGCTTSGRLLLGDAVDGYIQETWSGNVVYEWMTKYAEFLEYCVETLHSDNDSHGGCRASVKDLIGKDRTYRISS